MTDGPIALKARCVDVNNDYRAGRASIDDVYRAVDAYIDACAETFKTKWPNRRFKRPSRAAIVRNL